MLLQYPSHAGLKAYVSALNHFYLAHSELWEIDFSWEGFSWIANDDNRQNIIAFRRLDKKGGELIVLCSFSPVTRTNYRIGAPRPGTYREVFNSDLPAFGGTGAGNKTPVRAEPIPMHGLPQSIELTVPPLAAVIFEHISDDDQP